MRNGWPKHDMKNVNNVTFNETRSHFNSYHILCVFFFRFFLYVLSFVSFDEISYSPNRTFKTKIIQYYSYAFIIHMHNSKDWLSMSMSKALTLALVSNSHIFVYTLCIMLFFGGLTYGFSPSWCWCFFLCVTSRKQNGVDKMWQILFECMKTQFPLCHISHQP